MEDDRKEPVRGLWWTIKKTCKKIKVTRRISGSEAWRDTETVTKLLSLEGAIGMFLTQAQK